MPESEIRIENSVGVWQELPSRVLRRGSGCPAGKYLEKEGRGRVPVQGARQVLRSRSGVAGARVPLRRLEVGGRSGP